MLVSSLDTNTQKLKTVGIYLADVLYKTKQEEIEEYLTQDIQAAVIQAEVTKEINAKIQRDVYVDAVEEEEEDEQLNREYHG